MSRRFCFFDLDGTLADTDPDIRVAWKAALKALGLESTDFDEKFVAGPPLEEMLKMLFPAEYTDELGAAARREFGRVYDTCGFHHTPEYPGVLDAARELRARGSRLFIVTNKRLLGAQAIAAKYGWMEVFEGLYTGDMFVGEPPKPPKLPKPPKPLRKPELLKYVIESLGAPVEECVMIGDTASDFEAAAKNGVMSVAVAWGYGKPTELAAADRLVDEAGELLLI